MSIIKNDIPILEFDTDKQSCIMPNHENLNISLPERAVFPFMGSFTDSWAKSAGCKIIGEFESSTKNYPIYLLSCKGEEICLCQAPVGAAASAQILDWLISYGAKKIISAGSCGTLLDLPENKLLIPSAALRDEGASYHYAPPSRFIDVSPEARCAIKKALSSRGIDYTEVTTWSTDGFFRETAQMVSYRMSEGCSVVEMECSALAACAKFREAVWGEILYTGDSLADLARHDSRSMGRASMEIAMELCIESVLNL